MNKRNSVRILIAEDSRTPVKQLRFLLEQLGYQVTVTADGKQSLQPAIAEKPALSSHQRHCDAKMDDYKRCKTIRFGEIIPVILVTALSLSHDVIRELECGADNFICKLYDGYHLIVILPTPFLRALPFVAERQEL